MARRLWVGLDVGVETTSVCVIDADGAVLHETVCPTNAKNVHREIVSLGCRRSGTVGLESGTGCALARDLRSLGYTVEIYETRQLSKFLRIRRNKTDTGDALGIAHAGRIASPLVSRVRRVHACLDVEVAPYLETASNRLTFQAFQINPLAGEIRHLLGHIEELRTYKVCLDRELNKLALGIDICRRLMEIPGIGPICALTFYAAVGEPSRFRRASDIGPYLGLTPKLHQSGLAQRSGRISRMGNPMARSLLIQSSLRFMRCCDPQSRFKAWTSEIESRRGKGKSRVALARKLATVMVAMWKKGTSFDPQLVLACP